MNLVAGDDEKEGRVISALTMNKGTKCLLLTLFALQLLQVILLHASLI